MSHYSLGDGPVPLTADRYFQEKYYVSPMVVMFCMLPIKRRELSEERAFPISDIYERNLVVHGGQVKTYGDKRSLMMPLYVPYGMIVRRMLLFYFSQFYKNRHFVHQIGNSPREFAEDFGYSNYKSRHRTKYEKALFSIVGASFSFLYYEDNALYGKVKDEDKHDKMFRGRTENERLKTLFLNDKFMFNCAFPVDWDVVKNSKRKSFFWNIYLFLVDVMPRIPPKRHASLPWKFLHKVLGREYATVAQFKYEFSLKCREIREVYPASEHHIDVSDKTRLHLYHAPPPIKPPDPINPDTPAIAARVYDFNVA